MSDSTGTSNRCPASPTLSAIAYEGWEPSTLETRGYALVAANMATVAIDEEKLVPTFPVPGFAGELAGTIVEIPNKFPAKRSDEFEGISPTGLREPSHDGPGETPTTPSISIPAMPWRTPQQPPRGSCAISVVHLRRLRPVSGHVVASVPPEPGIAGGGFTSCADEELPFAHTSLDAAVLLSAARPGAAPLPLPNAHPVHGHRGIYATSGWSGPMLARRIHGAWLVVEGTLNLRQRELVLAHLRASIRL